MEPTQDNVIPREAFIKELKSRVEREGFGIVPLIGSGISHGSGIMIGAALGQYLSYVIWRRIHNYASREPDQSYAGDIAKKGWPSPPTQFESLQVAIWATKEYCKLLEEHYIHKGMAKNFSISDLYRPQHTVYRLPPVQPRVFDDNTYRNWHGELPKSRIPLNKLNGFNNAVRELHSAQQQENIDPFAPLKGISKTSHKYILESAIRSLCDWRLSLQFLARLQIDNHLLHLEDISDQYVIDSFNIFITQGRKPSLSHQMVAFLTRPLRIRKLLSTNFDTLLEDAYRGIDIPLQVFSIEKNSRLPDPDSIAIQKSLIKLHGSLHETRADYTLDESPDQRDKDVFLEYLWPIRGNAPKAIPSHLLVLGTSIPDKRNIELIKYVCDHAPDFRIFVIAYDQFTIDDISNSFGKSYERHLVFTKSSNLDLLLYEIYQSMTFSLPPAGFRFEFSQYIPPFEDDEFPYIKAIEISGIKDDQEHVSMSVADARAKIADRILKEADGCNKITIIDGPDEITKIGTAVFYEIKNKMWKSCIWFELEDFSHPFLLISEAFRTISIKLGLYTTENVSVEFPCNKDSDPDTQQYQHAKSKVDILIKHYGINPSNWCLFFYGRNAAGSCSGFTDPLDSDTDTSSHWGPKEFNCFTKIIEMLTAFGFKIVYLPYSEAKKRALDNTNTFPLCHDYKKIKNSLILHICTHPKRGLQNSMDHLKKMLDAYQPEVGREDRIRFIYAATLFRQSRHISALVSEPVLTSKNRYKRFWDDSNSSLFNEVVEELLHKDANFLHRKPGGLAWMFRDLRKAANDHTESHSQRQSRTRMHFWIGEWYLRAFYSSNHIDPLKEAIYHKIMCIHTIKNAELTTQQPIAISKFEYRQSLLCAALASLAKIFMISRESLRYWIGDHRSAEMFYWPIIKQALGIKKDLSISDLTPDNTKNWTEFTRHIRTLIDPQLESSFNPELFSFIQFLTLEIRHECFRLERHIMQNSSHYPNMKTRTEVPMYTNSKMFNNYLLAQYGGNEELYINYNPGDRLNAPFEALAQSLSEDCRACLTNILSLTDKYLHESTEPLVDELRALRHQYAFHFLNRANELSQLLLMVTDYIYRIIRQAKYFNRCLCIEKLNAKPSAELCTSSSIYYNPKILEKEKAIERHWQWIGLLSQCMLDLLHHLPSSYLHRENTLKIKLLTFAGLSLGRLHKYPEAHRILNEGTGIVYNLSTPDSRRELVIFRLRRAEIHVHEAIKLEKMLYLSSLGKHDNTNPESFDTLYRRHISKLDDAWTVLDEVEVMLSNCMHSAFWCGKLYYLRLMAYAELFVPAEKDGSLPYSPKALSNFENANEFLHKALEQGVLSSGDDEYRKLCFFNIYIKAVNKLIRFNQQLPKECNALRSCDLLNEAKARIAKISYVENPELELDWSAIIPQLQIDNPTAELTAFREGIVSNFKKHFESKQIV